MRKDGVGCGLGWPAQEQEKRQRRRTYSCEPRSACSMPHSTHLISFQTWLRNSARSRKEQNTRPRLRLEELVPGDHSYDRVRNLHSSTETANQVRVAPASTSQALWPGMNCHTNSANMRSPMLPIADPAASTLTASLPRSVPSCPCSCSFSVSCFSIRVAPAGKIAGNARNKPPTPAPYSLAMIPAAAVINPPKTNRTTYSCHFVRLKAEESSLTCMSISATSTTIRTLHTAKWAWSLS